VAVIGVRAPLAGALLAFALAGEARASCNVIPAATQDFRGALGSTNRPFASPGDVVEVRVRPAICDDTSTSFVDLDGDGSLSDDHVVTVLFVPPNGGTRNAVVLAESCAAVDLGPCTAALGGGTAECIEVIGGASRRALRSRTPASSRCVSPTPTRGSTPWTTTAPSPARPRSW
jgi:hypothetical protein